LGVPIGFREPRPLAASISKADIAQTCGNVRLNLWSVITRSPETNQCGEQEHEHQSGDDGDTGAESDVSKDVEYRDFVGNLDQPIEQQNRSTKRKSNYSHQLLSPSGGPI
jgi:hypothetical protein